MQPSKPTNTKGGEATRSEMPTLTPGDAKAQVRKAFPDAYAAFLASGNPDCHGTWVIRATWGGQTLNPLTGNRFLDEDHAWIAASQSYPTQPHILPRVPASSPTPAGTAGTEAKLVSVEDVKRSLRSCAGGHDYIHMNLDIVLSDIAALPAVRTSDYRGCDIPQALMERVAAMREAIFGTASDQNDNPSPSFTLLLKLREVLDDVLASRPTPTGAEASEEK